jgi:hypothetical protein
MIADILAEHLAGRLDVDENEFASTVRFLSWGLVGLFGSVTDTDDHVSAAEAYRSFERLAADGLNRRNTR